MEILYCEDTKHAICNACNAKVRQRGTTTQTFVALYSSVSITCYTCLRLEKSKYCTPFKDGKCRNYLIVYFLITIKLLLKEQLQKYLCMLSIIVLRKKGILNQPKLQLVHLYQSVGKMFKSDSYHLNKLTKLAVCLDGILCSPIYSFCLSLHYLINVSEVSGLQNSYWNGITHCFINSFRTWLCLRGYFTLTKSWVMLCLVLAEMTKPNNNWK